MSSAGNAVTKSPFTFPGSSAPAERTISGATQPGPEQALASGTRTINVADPTSPEKKIARSRMSAAYRSPHSTAIPRKEYGLDKE